MKSFPKTAPEFRPDENQFAKEVWEYLACKDILTRKFIQVCFVAIKMFDFKQTQYGVKNIQRGGFRGIVTRLGDKVSRLENLWDNKIESGEEGLADTAGDAGVYGLMGLMTLWGFWPEIPAHDSAPPQVNSK